jgi:KAP family P-loop domain
MSDNDLNKPVTEYLRYYADPENVFDFAVMVRGNWGAGKTYLINQFVAELKSKGRDKNLYVSLYGITSFRQIDEALFRQLHPVLSSKGMKLAATIGKGLLKATTKIDLDHDGKEDVSVTSNIPDVDLVDYFKTPKECLLIFDDLERCSMKVSDILGYINSFVEHEGFKAIIVANEEDIIKRGDERYAEIKEKLIGQTLTVRSTVKAAFSHFLSLIKDEKVKTYLRSHEEDVQLLHSQSETENLRLLKHALWDFEKMAVCLTATHWKNDEAIGILFRNIIALSFEVRSGRLSEEQLPSVPVDASYQLFRKRTDGKTPADELKTRYPEVEFDQKIATPEWLTAFYIEGWINPEVTRKMLDASPFYASPETLPAWKAAWHGWDIPDEQYEKAVEKVEKQFHDREFTIIGELFQVFGLRLLFSSIGVIGRTKAQVVAECVEYIDDLKKSGHLPDPLEYRRDEGISGWDGLGLFESETPEFADIISHFKACSEEALEETLPTRGRELLDLMKKDVQAFFRQLCVNNVTASPFFDIPILAKIEPEVFVDRVLELDPVSQSSVFSMFEGRYDRGQLDADLKAEKPWLARVAEVFRSKISSLRPMSRYRLKNRIGRTIDRFLPRSTASGTSGK